MQFLSQDLITTLTITTITSIIPVVHTKMGITITMATDTVADIITTMNTDTIMGTDMGQEGSTTGTSHGNGR